MFACARWLFLCCIEETMDQHLGLNNRVNRSLSAALVCLSFAVVFCAGFPVGCHKATPPAPSVVLQPGQLHEILGKTMGTTYMVKCFPGENVDLTQLASRIEEELVEVNQQMSTYIDSSEISKFNVSTSTDWQAVSDDFASVVELAQEISTSSDGAFDVTVGPLVDLWGFGSKSSDSKVPATDEIQRLLDNVGFEKLAFRLNPPALQKEYSELQIDLSAIAKGHGVDRICDLLEEAGVESYFVEVGGEVRANGKKANEDPWVVGIESPDPKQREVLFALELNDMALATSGDYRNFREIDGMTVSHTIDPRTGKPVEDPITSASAFAPTCAEADGIATAMMSAGFEDGLELAERNDWAVVLIARRGTDNENQLATSTAFRKMFPAENLNSELGDQP